MKTTRPPAHSTEEAAPGVPGFRTWRGVYLLVFLWFIGCVALLAWLSHAFK
ncbi:MAG TPA: hypothetical protein PKN95_08100 [Verrucomicrobiota bacterium]|nr:hypothetical protein [Verrucomicrobiota bacterium]HNT15237.1 hypothetical protein [Verrucomicrobiota bacterium]